MAASTQLPGFAGAPPVSLDDVFDDEWTAKEPQLLKLRAFLEWSTSGFRQHDSEIHRLATSSGLGNDGASPTPSVLLSDQLNLLTGELEELKGKQAEVEAQLAAQKQDIVVLQRRLLEGAGAPAVKASGQKSHRAKDEGPAYNFVQPGDEDAAKKQDKDLIKKTIEKIMEDKMGWMHREMKERMKSLEASVIKLSVTARSSSGVIGAGGPSSGGFGDVFGTSNTTPFGLDPRRPSAPYLSNFTHQAFQTPPPSDLELKSKDSLAEAGDDVSETNSLLFSRQDSRNKQQQQTSSLQHRVTSQSQSQHTYLQETEEDTKDEEDDEDDEETTETEDNKTGVSVNFLAEALVKANRDVKNAKKESAKGKKSKKAKVKVLRKSSIHPLGEEETVMDAQFLDRLRLIEEKIEALHVMNLEVDGCLKEHAGMQDDTRRSMEDLEQRVAKSERQDVASMHLSVMGSQDRIVQVEEKVSELDQRVESLTSQLVSGPSPSMMAGTGGLSWGGMGMMAVAVKAMSAGGGPNPAAPAGAGDTTTDTSATTTAAPTPAPGQEGSESGQEGGGFESLPAAVAGVTMEYLAKHEKAIEKMVMSLVDEVQKKKSDRSEVQHLQHMMDTMRLELEDVGVMTRETMERPIVPDCSGEVAALREHLINRVEPQVEKLQHQCTKYVEYHQVKLALDLRAEVDRKVERKDVEKWIQAFEAQREDESKKSGAIDARVLQQLVETVSLHTEQLKKKGSAIEISQLGQLMKAMEDSMTNIMMRTNANAESFRTLKTVMEEQSVRDQTLVKNAQDAIEHHKDDLRLIQNMVKTTVCEIREDVNMKPSLDEVRETEARMVQLVNEKLHPISTQLMSMHQQKEEIEVESSRVVSLVDKLATKLTAVSSNVGVWKGHMDVIEMRLQECFSVLSRAGEGVLMLASGPEVLQHDVTIRMGREETRLASGRVKPAGLSQVVLNKVPPLMRDVESGDASPEPGTLGINFQDAAGLGLSSSSSGPQGHETHLAGAKGQRLPADQLLRKLEGLATDPQSFHQKASVQQVHALSSKVENALVKSQSLETAIMTLEQMMHTKAEKADTRKLMTFMQNSLPGYSIVGPGGALPPHSEFQLAPLAGAPQPPVNILMHDKVHNLHAQNPPHLAPLTTGNMRKSARNRAAMSDPNPTLNHGGGGLSVENMRNHPSVGKAQPQFGISTPDNLSLTSPYKYLNKIPSARSRHNDLETDSLIDSESGHALLGSTPRVEDQ